MDTGPLADVAQPLQEAAGYEHLQLERRRGLVTLQFTLFLAGLASWGLQMVVDGLFYAAFPVTIGLFLSGAAVITFVRRNPAWNAVFVTYGGFQTNTRRLYMLGLALAFGIVIFLLPLEEALSENQLEVFFMLWMPLMAFGPGYRARDWALFHMGWFPVGMAACIALFWDPLAAYTMVLSPAALLVPMAALAAIRLFAPRRWLVR